MKPALRTSVLAFPFRKLAVLVLLAAPLSCQLRAQDTVVIHMTGDQPGVSRMEPQQIDGPACAGLPQWFVHQPARRCTAIELDAWRKDMRHWRMERLIRIGYDAAEYNRPELQWTQSSFIQPQMMVHDRYFFDAKTLQYTVARYVDDTRKRYGGIDSVLVWPTYPNIGIDDRNQYDLVSDMPGGIAGVKGFVDEFHKLGVKVLFPTMLWDQGTRFQGKPDAEALAEELASVGADGINGDTLQGVSQSFQAAGQALKHPLALEPEVGLASDELLKWNAMTWGYWRYDFMPTVSRYKWLEPRHMVNISNRWAHEHTDDLQFAFFNGAGFESWENVWGIWNGITPRNAEALRRISAIERFGKDFLVSADWEPHTATAQFGIFASKWPVKDETMWTLVNRNTFPVSGEQLILPHRDNIRYFDLWNGVELHAILREGKDVLEFPLEARGFGAVIATGNPSAELTRFVAEMHALAQKPLNSFSNEWATLPQKLVPIEPTSGSKASHEGMTRIPAAHFLFQVNGIEIEGGDDAGVDVQYPGEPSARRYHQFTIDIPEFWIDTYPVTNSEFKKFIDAAHYKPTDGHNFLKDWKDGVYPEGSADKPVVWVSLEDARAYAKWAGKRLPHEWEWQYAAQGTDGREYPWGNIWDATRVPTPDTGRAEAAAADVHAHPQGASPFGVQDLVGNVWQWTDEYSDDHTRAAILRGGSHYQPQGSWWYFPQAYKLTQHGKYLLMAPSLDRSASVGFRCAMD